MNLLWSQPHSREQIITHLVLRFILTLGLAALCAASIAAPPPVTLLTVNGAIGPATADYVSRGIARAAKDSAQLVILRMDTPGGLDTSMRTIIKAILVSPVPVAAYVAPSGARAASAGTFILYASHIAAMAPGTNLGAATPVQIGGAPAQPDKPEQAPKKEEKKQEKKPQASDAKSPEDVTTTPMTRKQVNDAAAYIRGLAQMRGRNMEWAERAVREAVSLSAEEARQQHVIEYVATDVPDLLKQVHGRKVAALGQERTLQTAAAPVVDYEPDWRAKLLATITDPSIALLLMMIGIYGLIFELSNPGAGVPGVIGGICLLLALYALQLLPVNYAGLALILLGIGFMVAEAFLPSFGVLGLGGIVAFVTGAVILIDTELPGFGIPLAFILTTALVSALLIATVAGMALRARRRATVGGESRLIGAIAEVVDDTPEQYWVRAQGETWRVISTTPLRRGQKVRVLGRNGLVLEVAPAITSETGE